MPLKPSEVNTKPDGMAEDQMRKRFDERLADESTWLDDDPGVIFAFPDMRKPTETEVKRLFRVLKEYEGIGWAVTLDGVRLADAEGVKMGPFTKVKFTPREV